MYAFHASEKSLALLLILLLPKHCKHHDLECPLQRRPILPVIHRTWSIEQDTVTRMHVGIPLVKADISYARCADLYHLARLDL